MKLVYQPGDALLLAHYGEILYQLAIEKGADPEQLLNNTGIRESTFRNPEAMLNYEQFTALTSNAFRLVADPALGLQYGTRLKFTTHGAMGQASISSENLSEAISSIIKYYRTRFAFIEMSFFIEGDEAVIQLDENLGLGVLKAFLIEALFVSIIDVSRFLFGPTLAKTGSCRVSYAPPSYVDQYFRFFVGDSGAVADYTEEKLKNMITFNAPTNQLRFDKQYLSLPMVLANSVARRLAEQTCEEQLKAVEDADSIVAKVKRSLQDDPDRIPSMEEVSDQLHMTSRTLRRQLQNFGTSFQDLLSDIRKKRAIALLQNTDKPVDEIAYELGYSDPSNFGRAFRKWTGKSPSCIRKEMT
ncbi:AraC family transcriptional regulator [Alkalimarinus sediminis]|uniref:AraC family transcriptional regulator n=1 Tax=Alkalimarinus sediminis TaxID=1632866 RepID=A0A9E8HJ10_9ALTE|nr:AraC family transcriptional regulator [Alkalimarinus sediminis]UZW75265.1 AraC family transcriptional regulator [Alkalimarinus sediminis]